MISLIRFQIQKERKPTCIISWVNCCLKVIKVQNFFFDDMMNDDAASLSVWTNEFVQENCQLYHLTLSQCCVDTRSSSNMKKHCWVSWIAPRCIRELKVTTWKKYTTSYSSDLAAQMKIQMQIQIKKQIQIQLQNLKATTWKKYTTSFRETPLNSTMK